MNKHISLGLIFDIIFYGAFVILLTILQTSFLPRLEMFGAFPDIIIGSVCCIGIYRGENFGALFGLIAALFVEALGSTGVSLLPIFYTVIGYISGRIGHNAHPKAHFSAFIICVPVLCLSRTVLSLLNHFIVYGNGIEWKSLFLDILIPEYIFTVLLCIPSYILFRIFDLPLYFARKRGLI